MTDEFEKFRPHLRAVAYRMLGSLAEADDVVQETWLRFARSDVSGVANLGGWLTTVAGRVCLDLLRARAARREGPLPDPVLSAPGGLEPEQQALLGDRVGYALMVVLDALGPAERVAFVLHDTFAVPFDDIAPVVGRSVPATKQLASRARRRVRDAAPAPDASTSDASVPGAAVSAAAVSATSVSDARKVIDAFLGAARGGDLAALVTLLDPEVMLTADRAGALTRIRGAAAVAGQAVTFGRFAYASSPILVNGTPGLLSLAGGRPVALMSFTVAAGRVTALHILADPARLATLGGPDLSGWGLSESGRSPG